MIKEKIKAEMIQAMKSKDSNKLLTIRMMMAKIKDKEISNRGKENPELDEQEILSLLQQMIKQRNDSITEYKKASRLDLSEKEESEIAVIKSFMPQELSEKALDIAISEAISQIKPESIRDIGKIVNYVKEKYIGRVNPTILASKVKEKLS